MSDELIDFIEDEWGGQLVRTTPKSRKKKRRKKKKTPVELCEDVVFVILSFIDIYELYQQKIALVSKMFNEAFKRNSNFIKGKKLEEKRLSDTKNYFKTLSVIQNKCDCVGFGYFGRKRFKCNKCRRNACQCKSCICGRCKKAYCKINKCSKIRTTSCHFCCSVICYDCSKKCMFCSNDFCKCNCLTFVPPFRKIKNTCWTCRNKIKPLD